MSLIYIGRGAAIPGIPARDLTDEEVEYFGGAESLVATGLYQAGSGEGPLEIIKGIGPKLAKELNKLGVSVLIHLVNADAGELADRLDGASLAQVEDWQGQAQSLLGQDITADEESAQESEGK